jgi:alanine dehydrogenase
MINFRDTTLLLKDEEIRKILSISPCIDAVEKAFKELAMGVAKNLPRARIYTPTGQDEETLYWFNNLAGAVPSLDTMVLRIDSRITKEVVVGGKKRKQLFGESAIGLVFVFRISTGELLAIMDDPTLSPIRVGATSAVALRYLARKDASVLGLIGSGNQARTQLQGAIAVIGGLKQIKVFSMNFKNRDRIVHEMKGETPAEVIGVGDPEAAVSESDVVICATNSSEPVFAGRWLRKGTTVISIVGGDHTLKRREIDDVVLEKSRAIFVNSKLQIRLDEQATLFDPIKKEIKRETAVFELGDLIKGNVPGRLDDEEIITYHNNCGMGIQFAAVGAVAYQRAIAAGVGRPLPAEWFRTFP